MSIETRRERIIYFALVPLIAAVLGALATAIFTGQGCAIDTPNSVVDILGSSGLSSAEKMKALEVYREVSDRPWSLVRSLTTLLFVLLGASAFAIAERIRGK